MVTCNQNVDKWGPIKTLVQVPFLHRSTFNFMMEIFFILYHAKLSSVEKDFSPFIFNTQSEI